MLPSSIRALLDHSPASSLNLPATHQLLLQILAGAPIHLRHPYQARAASKFAPESLQLSLPPASHHSVAAVLACCCLRGAQGFCPPASFTCTVAPLSTPTSPDTVSIFSVHLRSEQKLRCLQSQIPKPPRRRFNSRPVVDSDRIAAITHCRRCSLFSLSSEPDLHHASTAAIDPVIDLLPPPATTSSLDQTECLCFLPA